MRGRTNVGSGTPVLEITIALSTDVTRNTDGCATVGDTGSEGADVASLVAAGETHVVVLAVDSDVLVVALGHLGDCLFDELHATRLTHSLGRVVGMAAGAVPIALERLGMERDLDTPLLRDADEEVTGHPQVIAHRDALARAYLELPLGGHNLRVDARDVDTGVEAGAIVSFNQITGENLAST